MFAMASLISTLFSVTFVATAVAQQVSSQPASGTPQDVLTYHGDNLRTGWFSSETSLTPANVNPTMFGWLATVTLDARVDGEPLVARQQNITGQGIHDVVYVATENNSVYAVDAVSGAVLWQRNLGTAVPYSYKNFDDNVFPIMGILSTPVIDRAAGAIYLVADAYTGTVDYFVLHALSLASGKDMLKPAVVEFSHSLDNGTTWKFNSQNQLQRPGLLKANGNLYLTFGSTGDAEPATTRGGIVAYAAATLTPQVTALTDRLSISSNPYYLSSIWQSGFAPAADAGGDIYFSTGNSDPHQASYSASFNKPESAVRMTGNLSTVLDSFTPSNYFSLDGSDVDMGAGGMLLLPDQPGAHSHLAVAGGKDGRAFLIDRDNMGGYTRNGADKVLETFSMGYCWCGPSYYVGSDGTPRVITGGNNGVISWKLETSPTTQVVLEASTSSSVVAGLPDDGGVMPVVSSNGTVPSTAIIWFVQRPASNSDQDPGTPITLTAYAASNLSQPLISLQAGTWVHAVNSNANLVPTVSNGRVYVASNKQLQIFGILPSDLTAKVAAAHVLPMSAPDTVRCPGAVAPLVAFGGQPGKLHDFYGTVCQSEKSQIKLALRTGGSVAVDITGLNQNPLVRLAPGRPVHVRGFLDSADVLHAKQISRTHMISARTPPDR